MKPLHNDRGVALVMVLLVVTLLSIVIVEFAYTTLVYSHLARNSVNGLQAGLLARSGLNLGEAILVTDPDPTIDSFLEEWCPEPGASWCRIDESLLPLPGNMRIRIQIVDEGGKLNLNATRPSIAEYKQALANPEPNVLPKYRVMQVALKKLIEAAGGDPAAADRLDEYWAHLIETRFSGAVNDPASGQPGTVPTPGATPMTGGVPSGATTQQLEQQLKQYNFPSLDDANDVLGLDPRVLQRLRRFTTAYVFFSTLSKVNANTAPRVVLEAMFDDPSVVDAVVFQRETTPLQQADVNQLVTVDQQSPMANAKGMLGVTSNLYRIQASAIVNPDPVTGEGGLARSASILVRRTNSAVGNKGKAGNNGLPAWTLTRLDWQKEGGAVLFEEASTEPGAEPGAQDSDRASF